jgi:hypothetical protein
MPSKICKSLFYWHHLDLVSGYLQEVLDKSVYNLKLCWSPNRQIIYFISSKSLFSYYFFTPSAWKFLKTLELFSKSQWSIDLPGPQKRLRNGSWNHLVKSEKLSQGPLTRHSHCLLHMDRGGQFKWAKAIKRSGAMSEMECRMSINLVFLFLSPASHVSLGRASDRHSVALNSPDRW